MNLPFLVVPYSLSPEPWYTFVFRFTHTSPFDFAEAISLDVAGVGAALAVAVFAAGVAAAGAGFAAGAGDVAGLDIAIVAGAVFAGGVVVFAVVVLAADALAALAAAFFCAFVCAGVVVVVACAKITGCAKARLALRIVPSVTIFIRFFFIRKLLHLQ
jgi:hypothetical protein